MPSTFTFKSWKNHRSISFGFNLKISVRFLAIFEEYIDVTLFEVFPSKKYSLNQSQRKKKL